VIDQLPKVESNEPRLLTDSSSQNKPDQSFEEKLKYEQSRIGLLFNPMAQLDGIFASSNDRTSDLLNSNGTNLQDIRTEIKKAAADSAQTAGQDQPTAHSTGQITDQIASQSFSQKFWQELLAKTGWLNPNLAANPLAYQAFLQGTLAANLDLQSLVDEIVKQAGLVKEKGRTELRLTLKPAELGDIILTLSQVGGLVSIQIQASAEAKKAIEDRRSELEAALKKLNIHFDQIKIEEVSDHA